MTVSKKVEWISKCKVDLRDIVLNSLQNTVSFYCKDGTMPFGSVILLLHYSVKPVHKD